VTAESFPRAHGADGVRTSICRWRCSLGLSLGSLAASSLASRRNGARSISWESVRSGTGSVYREPAKKCRKKSSATYVWPGPALWLRGALRCDRHWQNRNRTAARCPRAPRPIESGYPAAFGKMHGCSRRYLLEGTNVVGTVTAHQRVVVLVFQGRDELFLHV
jgi:hypothetical protein